MGKMKDIWTKNMFGELPPAPKPPTAIESRDEALERVARNSGEWFDAALAKLEAIPSGKQGIFERFRLYLINNGMPEPHKPNVWGSLCRTAISRGILEVTGDRDKMKTTRSHARSSDILKRR